MAALPSLAQLPRQTASDVKNRWRDVVREVHQGGSVAVTNHSAIEMVLVDAATYERLAASAAALQAREASVLEDLAKRFDERLAGLRQADAADKVAQVFASKGRLATRPKAGASF